MTLACFPDDGWVQSELCLPAIQALFDPRIGNLEGVSKNCGVDGRALGGGCLYPDSGQARGGVDAPMRSESHPHIPVLLAGRRARRFDRGLSPGAG
jgi:hypothetical protein